MIEHGLESPYEEWLKDWDGEDDTSRAGSPPGWSAPSGSSGGTRR